MKFASWNLEGRLTNYTSGWRGSPEHILQGIEALDADVMVLPEAFLDEPAPGVDERLASLGYKWHDVLYEDVGRSRAVAYMGKLAGMRVLSRVGIDDFEEVRWGETQRRMVAVTVRDPETDEQLKVIGVHLDDRTEELRLSQVEDMAVYINNESLPTIVMGDFNAMHGKDWRARILGGRCMRLLARHIPSHITPPPGEFSDDVRGIAMRLTDMGSGEALAELEKRTRLRDLDSRMQATTTLKLRSLPCLPSVRIVQIDHMFASPEIATDRVVVARDGGSDHRAISASISLKTIL